MRRRLNAQPGSVALAVLLVATAGGIGPRSAHANLPPGTEGCNYISNTTAGIAQDGSDLPRCVQVGSGCYECCVTLKDQSGWLFCTEMPGSGFQPNCSLPQNWYPAWWPDPDNGNFGIGILPPDTTPTDQWTGDDNGLDLGNGVGWGGGSGGGGHGCLHQCPPAYGPTKYAVLQTPPHPPYIP
jgi:hypothetical protein